MSTQKTYDISVQTKDNTNIRALTGMVQNDALSNVINIQLMDDTVPFDFSEYTIITMTVQKPDESIYSDTVGEVLEVVDAQKGKVKVTLPLACVEQVGMHNMTVTINKGDTILTSAIITYNIIPTLSDQKNVSHESSYPSLQGIITQASEVLHSLLSTEDARKTAEEERNSAEVCRATAEETRETNEAQRIAYEEAREISECDRMNNEDTREINEEQRQANELERISNDEARQVMEYFDISKEYIKGNRVSYNGSTYECILESTGIYPSEDDSRWILIAKKGEDGQGSGDMLISVYDTNNRARDLFDYVDEKTNSLGDLSKLDLLDENHLEDGLKSKLGGAEFSDFDGIILMTKTIINAGAGWNSYSFDEEFKEKINGVPKVIAQMQGTTYRVQIKDITADGFLYRIVKDDVSTNTSVTVTPTTATTYTSKSTSWSGVATTYVSAVSGSGSSTSTRNETTTDDKTLKFDIIVIYDEREELDYEY